MRRSKIIIHSPFSYQDKITNKNKIRYSRIESVFPLNIPDFLPNFVLGCPKNPRGGGYVDMLKKYGTITYTDGTNVIWMNLA